MNYGIANKYGKPDMKKVFEILETVYKLGINSIDTAQDYGDSESILGKFMKISGIEFFITTKLSSLRRRNVNKKNLYSTVKRNLSESFEKLKVDKIYNFMIHDFCDLITYGDSLIEVLVKLKDERMVDNIGVSVYSTREAQKVIDIGVFDTIQIPINLFNHDFIRILKKLKSNGLEIFARSVFLQGLFFLEPIDVLHKLPDAFEYIKKLRKIAEDRKMRIGEIALRYILSYDVDSIVVGVENVNQIVQNVEYMRRGKLPEDLVKLLRNTFKSIPENVKDPRKWIIDKIDKVDKV